MSDKIGDEITAGYFKYRVNSISFKKELGKPNLHFLFRLL